MAKLAVCGRADTEVVEVTAPDIADVTGLGVRVSDGGSIYRPPNEERYCTLAHLDTEQQILTAAKRAVPQLVTGEQARAAAERTGLTAGQRDAMITMLTATTATTALVAAAGAGKTHTMAEFARLWTTFTGRRVIGLATATNAARVLASEGLAESYNIAEFLGKIEGSEELRRPVPLHQDDVLVLDEASQLSTADLAMIQEAARQPGRGWSWPATPPSSARSKPAGCSGCSPRRSRPRSCMRSAGSTRPGNAGRIGAAASRGPRRARRLRPARQDTRRRPGSGHDRAASMWLADHLRGKDVLLLAGSNARPPTCPAGSRPS